MTLKNKELSIWLIGPSAAGKTTISKLLYEEIKDKMNFAIVDGDQVRSLYENNLGYDKFSRSKNTKRYINLVNSNLSECDARTETGTKGLHNDAIE